MRDLVPCTAAGLLVPAHEWLPEEPFERHFGGPTPVGCNHLRCARCGAEVRQGAGHDRRRGATPDPRSVFARADWRIHPELTHDPEAPTRLYACRCALRVQREVLALGEPSAGWLVDPRLPWACAGHPRLALPTTLYGMRIAGECDPAALVSEALGVRIDAHARAADSRDPARWLRRLYHHLEHVPLAGALSRALSDRLDARDPVACGRAIAFFQGEPTAPGSERLAHLLVGAADTLAGTRDPFAPNRTLWVAAAAAYTARLTALASGFAAPSGEPGFRPGLDAASIEAARALLLAPGAGLAVWRAVRLADGEWIARHADAIAAANPDVGRAMASGEIEGGS